MLGLAEIRFGASVVDPKDPDPKLIRLRVLFSLPLLIRIIGIMSFIENVLLKQCLKLHKFYFN